MTKPFVSIIIPTYKDWDRLELCLQALERQSYPAASFEVIVVNNDAEDPKALPNFGPNFQLLSESQSGSYAARNTGIALAKGEIFAFTDSDCIPAVNWIETALDFLNEQPEFMRVGGKIELFISGNRANIAELYELTFSFPQQDYIATKKFAATANMFSHRRVFDKVGLFRADLLYGGDVEWGRRADSQGFRIGYSPNLLVRHPARSTIEELFVKKKRLVIERVQLSDQLRGGKLQPFLKLLYQLRPPLKRAWWLLWADDKALARRKTSLIALDYYLRIRQAIEWWRLAREKSKSESTNY